MNSVLSPLMFHSADLSFHSSPDPDFASLFEQCGIPLSDLGSSLSFPSQIGAAGSTIAWYEGTAPRENDLVELQEETEARMTSAESTIDATSEVTKHDEPRCSSPPRCGSIQQREIRVRSITVRRPTSPVGLAEQKSIDGFGSESVSEVRGPHPHSPCTTCVSVPEDASLLQREKRHSPAVWAALQRTEETSSVVDNAHISVDLLKSPSSPASHRQSQISSPTSKSPKAISKRKTSTPRPADSPATSPPMDFYAQQQFGAQLSSPVSMESSPCDNDSYLYTPEFSPHFGNFSAQDLMLNGMSIEPANMQRSRSTSYLVQRTMPMHAPDNYNTLSHYQLPSHYGQDEEVVPASNNSPWQMQMPDYTLQQDARALEVLPVTLPMSAPRPTMKRKNRPMPIATSMPRSSGGPQTAPLERRHMNPQQLIRPPLSGKRSFEDFSVLDEGFPTPAYQQVTTPTTKRVRSSQGFKHSMPASPYIDEPLFSPVYSTVNPGLALSMDPEQLLLSSPPFSQTDFCSSPAYIDTPRQANFNNNNNIAYARNLDMYGARTEALSPLDIEGVWAQKPMFARPQQIHSQPVYTTPRSVNYVPSSPIRKAMAKSRKAAGNRAISFCNYTAADKRTILSGVAPSGSNKKAVAKSEEMARSLSATAISA